jgi:hypothetical protein
VRSPSPDPARSEPVIAGLLLAGTWLASALIAIGWLIQWVAGPSPSPLSTFGFDASWAGVATFILLPSLRVALMIGLFARQRDTAYVTISSFVLLIIAVGAYAATHMGH